MVGLKWFRSYHRKKVVLGKQFLNDPRERVLDLLNILITHDFTDALAIVPKNKIQLSHFGASCKVSIEGFSVLRNLEDDYALDVFSFEIKNSRLLTQIANLRNL